MLVLFSEQLQERDPGHIKGRSEIINMVDLAFAVDWNAHKITLIKDRANEVVMVFTK